MEHLTPAQIVVELDKYIIGQKAAKRAVAIALRNRYRRSLLAADLRDEVVPKNILMIGPTGVGKTEIARRLANLARAPFVKVEATKFTEVGYVGRDVDSMVRDLVQLAIRMVETEKMEAVAAEADRRAVDRIVELLHPTTRRPVPDETQDGAAMFRQAFGSMFGSPAPPTPDVPVPAPPTPSDPEDEQRRRERDDRIRAKLRDQVASGTHDERNVDIEVEQQQAPFLQVFSPQGMEEMGMGDLQNIIGNSMNRGRKHRSVRVDEARKLLAQEEARNLIDHDAVVREAVERTEHTGIIFIDEMDKIAGRQGGQGPDVSREGVQRDLLPIIEGSTVTTKFGPVKTDHILFIAAGAFTVSRPSDLIPELQGRLPIRVELESLTEADFERILTEPRHALTRQYSALLATEGLTVEFTPDALQAIARIAAEVNRQTENIGARRLHTVMERLLEEVSYNAPDLDEKRVLVDADYVEMRLADIVKSEDLSRFIL